MILDTQTKWISAWAAFRGWDDWTTDIIAIDSMFVAVTLTDWKLPLPPPEIWAHEWSELVQVYLPSPPKNLSEKKS